MAYPVDLNNNLVVDDNNNSRVLVPVRRPEDLADIMQLPQLHGIVIHQLGDVESMGVMRQVNHSWNKQMGQWRPWRRVTHCRLSLDMHETDGPLRFYSSALCSREINGDKLFDLLPAFADGCLDTLVLTLHPVIRNMYGSFPAFKVLFLRLNIARNLTVLNLQGELFTHMQWVRPMVERIAALEELHLPIAPTFLTQPRSQSREALRAMRETQLDMQDMVQHLHRRGVLRLFYVHLQGGNKGGQVRDLLWLLLNRFPRNADCDIELRLSCFYVPDFNLVHLNLAALMRVTRLIFDERQCYHEHVDGRALGYRYENELVIYELLNRLPNIEYLRFHSSANLLFGALKFTHDVIHNIPFDKLVRWYVNHPPFQVSIELNIVTLTDAYISPQENCAQIEEQIEQFNARDNRMVADLGWYDRPLRAGEGIDRSGYLDCAQALSANMYRIDFSLIRELNDRL